MEIEVSKSGKANRTTISICREMPSNTEEAYEVARTDANAIVTAFLEALPAETIEQVASILLCMTDMESPDDDTSDRDSCFRCSDCGGVEFYRRTDGFYVCAKCGGSILKGEGEKT